MESRTALCTGVWLGYREASGKAGMGKREPPGNWQLRWRPGGGSRHAPGPRAQVPPGPIVDHTGVIVDDSIRRLIGSESSVYSDGSSQKASNGMRSPPGSPGKSAGCVGPPSPAPHTDVGSKHECTEARKAHGVVRVTKVHCVWSYGALALRGARERLGGAHRRTALRSVGLDRRQLGERASEGGGARGLMRTLCGRASLGALGRTLPLASPWPAVSSGKPRSHACRTSASQL